MPRQPGQRILKVFWPNAGSLRDYPRTTSEILAYIRDGRPTRDAAIRWIRSRYGVVHEFARKLLNILAGVGLITYDRKSYGPTPLAASYLDTGDSQALFRAFAQKAAGFRQLIELLEPGAPLPLRGLETRWAGAMKPLSFAKNQCPIRYNWLRGFGYASVVAHQILLTEKGLKLAADLRIGESEASERRTELSHVDLEDKVRLIGEFFEFEAKKRPSVNDALPSYALKLREGDRQLDCLWVRYIPFAGQIKFPVEIQLGGNLADSLDRLETVSQYVQRAIMVTTEDQEQRIIDRLKVKKSHLLDKLTIVFVEDIYKAVEAAGVLRALAKRIFTD